MYRILLFISVHWWFYSHCIRRVEVKSNSSPFVMIFHNLDSNVVAFCAELRHSSGIAVGV
ncbi:hypothetical protein ACULNC_08510 [Shigella flexneri]